MRRSQPSTPLNRLLLQLAAAGMLAPVPEYHFAPHDDRGPVRKWRFDLAWPSHRLAVELEGGLFTGGRHGGHRSVVRDVEKRAVAAALGWRVLPILASHITSGYALTIIEAALGHGEVPL